MAEFIYKKGEPVQVPHTPVGDVAAGATVNVGDHSVGIAHAPIAAGQQGVVSVGNGLYLVRETGIQGALDGGRMVYLNGGAFSHTAGKHLGYPVDDVAATLDAADVREWLMVFQPEAVTVAP